METHSRPSKKSMKFSSLDQIHGPATKKKFPHVESKVKAYIDNIRKEDRQRQEANLIRYRSEPSVGRQSSFWELSPSTSHVSTSSTCTNCKMLMEEKQKMRNENESLFSRLASQANEYSELKIKLDVLRLELYYARRSHTEPLPLPQQDGVILIENDATEDVVAYNDATEDVVSYNDTTDDKAILLEMSRKEKKNVKRRIKIMLRCCLPCVMRKEE